MECLLKNFGDKYFIDGKIDREKVITALKSGDKDLHKILSDNKVFKNHFMKVQEDSSFIDTDRVIQTIKADEYWSNYCK